MREERGKQNDPREGEKREHRARSNGADFEIPPPDAPLSARDFLALKIPPREHALPPWLPMKGLALIASQRGVGKTLVAMNVGFAVANGGEFLGWKAPQPRRVLYVDGEMPADLMQERLRRITLGAADARKGLDRLKFMLSDFSEFGFPDLSTIEGQETMRPYYEPFDLVIFDNLSALCRTGDENEGASWTLMQATALGLRRAGKSAIFIHHMGRNNINARGTSRREDVLDSVLLLKHPEDYEESQGARFAVHFDKHRGFWGDDARSFEAKLDQETGVWTVNRVVSRDAEIREMNELGFSVREIAKNLSLSKSAVARVVKRAKEAANGAL